MISGNVNPNTSRRIQNIRCEYWLVSKEDALVDKSVLINRKTSDGVFYAKLESDISNSSNVVANSFMFDSTSLTISTNDMVSLKRNAIVVMWGMVWRVDDVQIKPIRTINEFNMNPDFKTIIAMRR